MFICFTMSVSADVFEKNINYDNIVTEYYSDDIYEDIVNTSAFVNKDIFDIPVKSETSTGINNKNNDNAINNRSN